MENYFLKKLNVVLKSNDQNTSTVEIIVEFDTLHYGADLTDKKLIGDHLKLTYMLNHKKTATEFFQNGFFYPEQIDWNYKVLTITVVVIDQEDTESTAVTKGEEDVIKPSEPLAR